MIDKESLVKFIEERLKDTDYYPVEISVKPTEIIVEIDTDGIADIDFCAELSREIESNFEPEIDDYTLEVGSAGITSPLRVKRQYAKYIGKEMEGLTKEGKKIKGILKSAGPENFVLEIEEKVKPEGAKRPVIEKREVSFGYGDLKEIKYLLKF